MTTLFDRLLERAGKTRADVASSSKVGKLLRKRGVARTPDFERVLYLPRRDWREGAEELAELLTQQYALPPQHCPKTCACRGKGHMALRPVQAAAIANLHDFGGLFAPIVVGGGKTLVSFLTPRVLGAERPLVLVPAKLRRKTENEWYKLAVHFRIAKVRVESYERLSRVENLTLLQDYAPDFIFADEAHRLKNTQAAVTRRVARYLSENPTRVAIASGTLTTKSLRDYWHLLRWSLGKGGMPLPHNWLEMMEWAEALDARNYGVAQAKMAPGCLSEFTHKEEPTLEEVRDGYRRRLVETPGVVSTSSKHVGCSLQIVGHDIPGLDKLHAEFKTLRQDWQTPDGWTFTEAVDRWRHARELACGFYYVWDPRPPPEWMAARKNWHRFVRQTLSHSRTYDTELMVAQAAARGRLDTVVEVVDLKQGVRFADVYEEWCAVRDTFKPNTVPVWVDDSTLRFAEKWLSQNDGICFVEHPCFGEKLAQRTGLPYFGRGGQDDQKRLIDDYPGGPVVASALANNEGRNLQFAWSRALVVSCPPNATFIEQLLGRLHRDGQESDEVVFDWVLACREHADGFYKAVAEAEYIEQTTGQPQKLLYSDRDVLSPDEVESMVGSRWC